MICRNSSPSSSTLWVLMDEDVKHLNDAAFGFGMDRAIWYDIRGAYRTTTGVAVLRLLMGIPKATGGGKRVRSVAGATTS